MFAQRISTRTKGQGCRRLALLVMLACVAGGCGSRPKQVALITSSFSAPGGELVDFVGQDLGKSLNLSISSTASIVALVEGGARPSLVVVADDKMASGLAESFGFRQVRVASNALVAVSSNPQITKLTDLNSSSVSVSVCDGGTPCGALATRMLGAESVSLGSSVSVEPDVRAVVSRIINHQAEVGFVYKSDLVGALSQVAGIHELDSIDHPVAHYVALVDSEALDQSVRRWIQMHGREALVARGYSMDVMTP